VKNAFGRVFNPVLPPTIHQFFDTFGFLLWAAHGRHAGIANIPPVFTTCFSETFFWKKTMTLTLALFHAIAGLQKFQ